MTLEKWSEQVSEELKRHDGCDGCIHEDKPMGVSPCSVCKCSYVKGTAEHNKYGDCYTAKSYTKPNKRTAMLEEVAKIVNGERVDMYGAPEDSFSTIAKYWSVYKGVEFTCMDVAMMLSLMKFGRQQHKPKHDNMVDICGYVICAADLE